MVNTTVEERFWAKVDRNGPVPEYAPHLGPCWMWAGAPNRDGGYGTHRTKTGRPVAHRYAYELLVGPIPDGLDLDHLCRVRMCVNPEHLEPVTRLVNNRRGRRNQNGFKTHCDRGHEFTPENTYRKPNGGRSCRECARMRCQASRARARRAA
jgi:hypothetical protein